MRIGSLFSGIGGLDLGVESATGARTVWQVERDPWCRGVLAHHWPNAKQYDDVCSVGAELERVDIIAGGFPCQDVSVAGKRAGLEGARSGLWWEYARIVRVLRPRFVFVENVAGLLTLGLDTVLASLAALGYDAEWGVFRAEHAGAPHRRERVFVLAVADAAGVDGQGGVGGGSAGGRPLRSDRVRCAGTADAGRVEGIERSDVDLLGRRSEHAEQTRVGRGRDAPDPPAPPQRVETQPGLGGVADGVPGGLDAHRWPAGRGEAQHGWEAPRIAKDTPHSRPRLKALGNAVVPQQAAFAWRTLYDRLLAPL